MSRNRRIGVVAGVSALISMFDSSITSAAAQDRRVDPAEGQKVLNFLADLPMPSAPVRPGTPYLPKGSFSSWSDEDKAAVPGGVTRAMARSFSCMSACR